MILSILESCVNSTHTDALNPFLNGKTVTVYNSSVWTRNLNITSPDGNQLARIIFPLIFISQYYFNKFLFIPLSINQLTDKISTRPFQHFVCVCVCVCVWYVRVVCVCVCVCEREREVCVCVCALSTYLGC